MTKPKFKVVARPGVEVSPEYVAEVQEAFDRQGCIDYPALASYGGFFLYACPWGTTREGQMLRDKAHELCTLELAKHTCECKWCGK